MLLIRQVGRRLIIGCENPGGMVEKKTWLKRVEERKGGEDCR